MCKRKGVQFFMINYNGRTELGTTLKKNEDGLGAVAIKDTLFLIIVDAFGTQESETTEEIGKNIADIMLDFIKDNYYKTDQGILNMTIQGALSTANLYLRTLQKYDSANFAKCGASVTICGILPTKRMILHHIGITRLYILRNGQLFCGTEDHNEAFPLLANGTISLEEYETSPLRNKITKGIGAPQHIQPFVTAVDLQDNDIVLLATDGIYRTLGDERIKNLIIESGNLDLTIEWLIKGALQLECSDNLGAIASVIT